MDYCRCICGSCQVMKTEQENQCCRSIKKVLNYIPDELLCITDCPGFISNCLDQHVLEASRWEYIEQQGPLGNEQLLNEYENASFSILIMSNLSLYGHFIF